MKKLVLIYKKRLIRFINKRKQKNFFPMNDPQNKIYFCMFCIIVLFGFSSFIMISDYMSFTLDPVVFIRNSVTTIPSYTRTFEVIPGNGFVSPLENIFIWVGFLWGFMRLNDLFRLWDKQDKFLQWSYFWELSE